MEAFINTGINLMRNFVGPSLPLTYVFKLSPIGLYNLLDNNFVFCFQDFRITPPGSLALDLMFNFAQNQTDLFSKMTIENSYRIGDNNHACPFAASSIALSKLICESLHVGGLDDVQTIEIDLQPMIFSQESPLDTIFWISIQHLFKTWREMRATAEDFDKVSETKNF